MKYSHEVHPKYYLLAYFPLFLIISFCLIHPTPGIKRWERVFLKSLYPFLKWQPSQHYLICRSWCGGNRISTDSWMHFSMSLPVFSTLLYPPSNVLLFPSGILFLGYFWLEVENWLLQYTLNLRKVVDSRNAPWTFFLLNKGTKASKPKKKSWPTLPSLPRNFPILVLKKSPHPYKLLSCEQIGMTSQSLGVDLFLCRNCPFLSLAFYLPQIYLKFCLKPNLCFALSLKEVRITGLHVKFTSLLIIKLEWVSLL